MSRWPGGTSLLCRRTTGVCLAPLQEQPVWSPGETMRRSMRTHWSLQGRGGEGVGPGGGGGKTGLPLFTCGFVGLAVDGGDSVAVSHIGT